MGMLRFIGFRTVFCTRIALLIALSGPLAHAERVAPETYDFPVMEANLATFYSVCLSGSVEGEDLAVTTVSRKVERYRKFRSLNLKLFKSAPSAPLVFILSGLGGDENSSTSLFLANEIQKLGFNAVVVPNTMTANFAVSTSRSGLVGLTGQDAQDLYAAIVQALPTLKAEGLTANERYLVGYSHGALLSAYLTALDQKQPSLFKSTLLINPPVDLLYGLQVLDRKIKAFKDISLGRLLDFATDLKGKVKRCAKNPEENLSPAEFISSLDLKDSEAEGLIGMAFGGALKDLILATEAIQDHDILPPPGLPGSAVEQQQNAARRKAAGRISFQNYVELILQPHHPSVSKGLGLIELSAEASLPFALNALVGNRNLFLMHNADDFLLRPADLGYLENYFGERARIYPNGGHLGNLGHFDNLKALAKWLKTGRIN